MDAQARMSREATAIVLGCDTIGSAVAHALHRAGWAVVVVDEIDPSAPHRGLSFTNAWYLGSAELAGIAACFCSSAKSIPSLLHRRDLVAATSWSWPAVAALVAPEIVVDARVAARGVRDRLLARAPDGVVTIGCGPRFSAGVDVDIAVDTSHARAGRWTCAGGTTRDIGEPPDLGGVGAARFLAAPRTGRMRTLCRIGERVAGGAVVGDVNGAPLVVRVAGVLRGLSARGARVDAGDIVAEVDPRGDVESCYGLDERGMRVAIGVLASLAPTTPRPDRCRSGLPTALTPRA